MKRTAGRTLSLLLGGGVVLFAPLAARRDRRSQPEALLNYFVRIRRLSRDQQPHPSKRRKNVLCRFLSNLPAQTSKAP
jgi:hypothetical protein